MLLKILNVSIFIDQLDLTPSSDKHALFRAFSRENMFVNILTTKKLQDSMLVLLKNAKVLIYYVVIIQNHLDFEDIVQLSRMHNINKMHMAMIFINKIHNFDQIYSDLERNILNLNFKSKLLVKFYNDPVIKIAFSVREKHANLIPFGTCSEEDGSFVAKYNRYLVSKLNLPSYPLKVAIANVRKLKLLIFELKSWLFLKKLHQKNQHRLEFSNFFPKYCLQKFYQVFIQIFLYKKFEQL